MQHQKLRTQRQRPLYFAAKRSDRLGMKLRIAARQVHQIVGVDDQRLQIIALAKA